MVGYPAQPRLPAPADMMDLVVEPQQCTGYSAHCVPRLAVRMYDVWHYVVVILSSYLTPDWTRTSMSWTGPDVRIRKAASDHILIRLY